MIHVVSTRKDFIDPHVFAAGPAARVRRLRGTRSVHRWRAAPSGLPRHLNGKRVLVLVHGFNISAREALVESRKVCRRLGKRLPGAYDHFVLFTWPGGTSRASYFAAKSRVREAGRRLGVWLGRLAARGARLDLFTHSMGARLAHGALAEAPEGVRIRNSFALAPAVGWDALSGAAAAGLLERTERLVLFYSRQDRVLGWWFPLFEWCWALGAVGPKDPEALARAWPGVEAVAVEGEGHSTYIDAEAVYDAMAQANERSAAAIERASVLSNAPQAKACAADLEMA